MRAHKCFNRVLFLQHNSRSYACMLLLAALMFQDNCNGDDSLGAATTTSVGEPRSFRIALDGLDGATLKLEGSDLGQGANGTLDVKANQLRNVRAFVTLPKDAIAAKTTDYAFKVVDTSSADTVSANVRFEAPSGTGQ